MLQSFRQSRRSWEARRFHLEQLEDRVQPNDMFSLGSSALLGLDSTFLFRDPLATALRSAIEPEVSLADTPVATKADALASVVAAVQFVNLNDLQPVSDLNAPPVDPGSQLGLIVASLTDEGTVQGAWFPAASVPIAMGLSQTTVVADDNGFVYSIGGGVGPGPTSRLNSVLAYDPTDDTWSLRASIPIAAGMAGYGSAVHYNGFIYVFGGIQGAGGGAAPINTTWIYDIANDTWSAGANMPGARFGSAVAVINDLIFVAGGADTQQQRTTWVYDPASDAWTTGLAPIPTSVPNPFRIHAAAVGCEMHAVAGGFGGFNHIVYDACSDSWQVRPRMPFGATDPGVDAVGDNIYVTGGDGNVIGVGLVQVYDTVNQVWSQAPYTPAATSNTDTAYNAAYGTLHVVGGFFGGQSIPDHAFLYV